MADIKAKVLDRSVPPFERLKLLLALLRSPEGCAWDRKQTHASLLPYLIEEAYEVVEAVEAGDPESLREELGDLLCQVVFHAQLASEAGRFAMDDATTGIVEKLIARHPHVFGDRKDLTPKQVRDRWEQIKIDSGEKPSVLSGVPTSMPALTMAFRIGEKAGGVGFDWTNPHDVLEKIKEESAEIRRELKSDNKERLTDEIGDLLFAAASLARKLEIDPERALKKALAKFQRRFQKLEEAVGRSEQPIQDYSLEELEEIWQHVK